MTEISTETKAEEKKAEAVPGNLFVVSPLPSVFGDPKPGTIIR